MSAWRLGSAHYSRVKRQLVIDIENRINTDHPGGIKLPLSLEACTPAIATLDYASIFSEHLVVHHLDEGSSLVSQPTFVTKEKVCFLCFF